MLLVMRKILLKLSGYGPQMEDLRLLVPRLHEQWMKNYTLDCMNDKLCDKVSVLETQLDAAHCRIEKL